MSATLDELKKIEFLNCLKYRTDPRWQDATEWIDGSQPYCDSLERIDFAYDLASLGHRWQFRDNGVPYFEHCRETAMILMNELGIFDAKMIIAALLHDMLEDSFLLTYGRIRIFFGWEVALAVNTLTKPKKTDQRFKNDDQRHEHYFNQLYQANSAGILIIKFCDRLHNLRTLDQCAPEKQARKIKETRIAYLPLLDRIKSDKDQGIARLAVILEDKLKTALNALDLETRH